MKKSTSKTVLVSILVGLAGLGFMAFIGTMIFIISQKSVADESDQSDGWVEIGRVHFANEYGTLSLDEADKIGEKTSKKFDKDDRFEVYSYILQAFYASSNMNNDSSVRLFVKETGGYRTFLIGNEQSSRWVVETGNFKTKAKETYNARILVERGDGNDRKWYPLYFNLPE